MRAFLRLCATRFDRSRLGYGQLMGNSSRASGKDDRLCVLVRRALEFVDHVPVVI